MGTPEQKTRIILERTLKIYTWIMILIFVLLFARIAWLQLIRSELYRTQAASNTMRWIPVTASRGEIVDTNLQVLATNRPVFIVSLDYLVFRDQNTDEVISRLVSILQDPEITAQYIEETINAQGSRLFEPIIIKRDIPIEMVTTLEENRRDLPGVSIFVQPQRYYPYSTLAGHLLGYVHSIKEELELPEFENYGLNDLVGKTGIEKTYEKYLRGENGYRQVEVTARNRPVNEVRTIPPVTGHKLVLTVDIKLQQAMEDAFNETLEKVQKEHPKAKAGAAVLLDVKTGKVLAMASRPTLNPDDFNGKSLQQDLVDYYFRNLPPALYNRAIQGNYVPGSTFKPVTGMAVLESLKASPKDTVVCTGRYWNAPYIKCWGVHGRVDYYSAMAHSCNVYFQEMARRAGIGTIGRVGKEFGLGELTGIDLPFESSGLLPGLEWQEKEFNLRADRINKQIDDKKNELDTEYQEKINNTSDDKEKRRLEQELNSKKKVWEQERKIQLDHYTQWHEWDTYNTGIGQGYNQFSIIQIANYTAAVANGGKLYKPFVVEKIIAPDGTVLEEIKPQLIQSASVSQQNILETQKAMTAVTAPGGTAYSLFRHFPEQIKVAAKTGTAQPGRAGYIKNKDYDGLFIAFAPADDPQIAFAGVIEHGYSGSGSVGLVAKAVFEEYFQVAPRELNLSQASTDRPENTADSSAADEAPSQPEDTGVPEANLDEASTSQENTGAND